MRIWRTESRWQVQRWQERAGRAWSGAETGSDEALPWEVMKGTRRSDGGRKREVMASETEGGAGFEMEG